jgi:hypothetical protein
MAKTSYNDALKGYVTVARRIERFYEKHPNGRILTDILEHDSERGFVLMKVSVYRNPEDTLPSATGHAYEFRDASYVNKTSYIENCETSAAGRAIALLGFEIKDQIASREEMEKVQRMGGQIQRDNQPPSGKTPAHLQPVPSQQQSPGSIVGGILKDIYPNDAAKQKALFKDVTGKESIRDIADAEFGEIIGKLKTRKLEIERERKQQQISE